MKIICENFLLWKKTFHYSKWCTSCIYTLKYLYFVMSEMTVSNPTHLSPKTKLDLVHQDESVGHDGLWPVQHHTTFDLFTPLINHLSGDVICFDWESHMYHDYNKNVFTFSQNSVTSQCAASPLHAVPVVSFSPAGLVLE